MVGGRGEGRVKGVGVQGVKVRGLAVGLGSGWGVGLG